MPWEESLIDQHAEVKYLSFRSEIDAYVFPCLGDRHGCQRLMREIRRKPGFLPQATWLIACPDGYCGTVQGVMDRGPIGAIQNVGVVPAYRGLGLGRALVRQALEGFYQAGLAPGLPRGDRRELRRRPALPGRRLPPRQDAVQGGRRLNPARRPPLPMEAPIRERVRASRGRLSRTGRRPPVRSGTRMPGIRG